MQPGALMRNRHFSRRTFLATASAASLTATLPGSLWWPSPPQETHRHTRALVIGSGYGGAVAALRLGQQGVSTLVLEMGREFTERGGRRFCQTLLPDDRAMWFRTHLAIPYETMFNIPTSILPLIRSAGILDRVEFDEMNVYVGRGFGGGSLINGSIAVTPDRAEFEKIFPQVDADRMYQTYFPRASSMLKATSIPVDFYQQTDVHQYSRVGQETADRAGFSSSLQASVHDFDYLRQESSDQVPRSATAQELFFGCNFGRWDLTKTYWPAALATGHVDVSTLTEATSITSHPGGGYLVTTKTIDPWGHITEHGTVTCEHLFLAAGSLGTSKLLVQAAETGTITGLSDQVGRGWGQNGDTSVSAANPWNRPTGAIQSSMPVVTIEAPDQHGGPVLLDVVAHPLGVENFTTSWLGVTDTGERANFSWDTSASRLRLDWKRSQHEPAIAALQSVTDKIVATNDMTYRDDLHAGERFGREAWHPLGGANLGTVTDLYGRVNGVKGLYVVDSALIPGYAGANPLLTITALAEHCLDKIVKSDITST